MAGARLPLIKELGDAELEAFIEEAKVARASWDRMALGGMSRSYRERVAAGFFKWDRALDIAYAVKKNRMKAGSWNPASGG